MQANYPPRWREMPGGRATTGVQVADHVDVATSLARDSTPESDFRILRIFALPPSVGVHSESETVKLQTIAWIDNRHLAVTE